MTQAQEAKMRSGPREWLEVLAQVTERVTAHDDVEVWSLQVDSMGVTVQIARSEAEVDAVAAEFAAAPADYGTYPTLHHRTGRLGAVRVRVYCGRERACSCGCDCTSVSS